MKLRSVLSVFLLLCLLLTGFPVTASAVVVTSGSCGADGSELTWTLDDTGTMTISGTGAMADFNQYSNDSEGNLVLFRYWNDCLDQTRRVVIEEGVTYIGDHAFLGAGNLKEIVLADSVQQIGNQAFANCDSLTTISFGNGLVSTGIEVFYDCDGLTSVSLPNRDIAYGDTIFGNCDNLKNVTIPEKQTTIGEKMFNDCISLTQITIPETITTIDVGAFSGCIKLKEITIPSSVTSIAAKTFQYCDALTSVVIPATVTEIGDYAFEHCDALTSVSMPEGLTELGTSVFAYCPALTSVTVPSTVTQMRHTFQDANGLETVKFLGNAPVAGNNLFGNITVTAYFPSNLPSWTEAVLTDYGGDVTWIGYTSSISPDGAIASGSCGANLTWEITNDYTLVISGSGAMIDLSTDSPWKSWNSRIAKIVIEEGVTSIGANAFDSCAAVESVSIPETVTSIGQNSFHNCVKLKELVIPAGVTSVGAHAFSGCIGLESVHFTGDAPEMGTSIFYEVTTTVHYPGNNTTWTADVRQNYDGTITWIGDGHEHHYTAEVIAPTCTEKGYTVHTCADCGGSYQDTYVDALGHDLVEATCTEPKKCRREGCGYTEGEALGHSWDDKTAALRTCTVCGTSEVHEHTYESVTTAPTCTEKGATTHTCSDCGHSYQDAYVDALGHDLADATCTEPKKCRREGCDYTEGEALGHSWEDETAVVKTCKVCGQQEGGYRIALDAAEFGSAATVWIDGSEYAVTVDGSSRYVELEQKTATNLVVYTYNDPAAEDLHTQYPTGMKVWILSFKDDAYTATYIKAFDNLLQYSGCSIRITGKKGIRMITSITKSNKTALTGKGLAGYTLVEYGTALAWASDLEGGAPLILGQSYTKSNYAYKKGVADPVFKNTGKLVQYTNVLVGFNDDQCIPDLAMRPYIILADAAGNRITIYGGVLYRNIGYIAYQNRNAFKAGSSSYDYVWGIIHHVYGKQYDSEYKG